MFYEILELNFRILGGGRKEAQGHRLTSCLAQREAPSRAPPEPQGQRLRGSGRRTSAAPWSGHRTSSSVLCRTGCPRLGAGESPPHQPQPPVSHLPWDLRGLHGSPAAANSSSLQAKRFLQGPQHHQAGAVLAHQASPGVALLGSVFLGEFS